MRLRAFLLEFHVRQQFGIYLHWQFLWHQRCGQCPRLSSSRGHTVNSHRNSWALSLRFGRAKSQCRWKRLWSVVSQLCCPLQFVHTLCLNLELQSWWPCMRCFLRRLTASTAPERANRRVGIHREPVSFWTGRWTPQMPVGAYDVYIRVAQGLGISRSL